jgi:DNA-binding IclR family transcriptional regulator
MKPGDGMTPRKAGSVAELKVRSGRKFISGLARGIQLLEAFRPGDDLLTNAELAARCGLPRPTVSRLTHTLCELGYIERGEDGAGYYLTPRILTLGHPMLAKLRIRQVARPLMQEMARETHLSVGLGVRDGLEIVFIERVRNSAASFLVQDIGARCPIGVSSMGRAYLAGLEANEREAILEELEATIPKKDWPCTLNSIEREMKRFATSGYCFSLGEWKNQAFGVSVPLVLPDGTVVAMNCGGMGPKVKALSFDKLGRRLNLLAKRILMNWPVANESSAS